MDLPQLIALVLLLLLAGFFSGTTVAFLNVNQFSIEIKRRKGEYSGRILSLFNEAPVRFISSGILGYLACVVLLCILLNYILTPFWERIPFGSFNALYLKILVQFLIAGVLLLIFTLFSRSFFRARANRLLPFFAFPVSVFSRLFYPLASVSTAISHWMLQYLFNVRITRDGIPFDKVGEAASFFGLDTEENRDENINTRFFENALNLPRVKIRNCLIPRNEIKGLPTGCTLEELKQKFVETQFTKIIIFDGNIDNIVGYVHQLDLFAQPTDTKEMVHPIMAVPETMSVIRLLTTMTRERKSIAWVIDEFGGTRGIVTIEDLLEEIFGDISDEHDVDHLVNIQIAEKEYLFSGRVALSFLSEKYGFSFGDSDSETLSGYVITKHESIPSERERIIIGDFEFDVIHVSETRIELLKMRVLK